MNTIIRTVGQDAQTIANLFTELAHLQFTDPDYFAQFDDNDPATASRSDIMALIETAPNHKVQFFLLGHLSARVALAAITSKAF